MAEPATPQAGAVFDSLESQPRVRDFLRRAAQTGKVGQAYLFMGAPGAGQREAAQALAAAAVCPQGGCGVCEDCRRALAGTHPDVRWEEPESAVGYVADQVRSIIAEAPLAPVRGQAKVYVVERADRLRGTAANALLKTLEEPPGRVVFVLMAPSADAVLPTLVSRCQQVPFAPLRPADAAERLARETGASPAQARLALAVCESPEAARSFLGPEGASRQEACKRAAEGVLAARRADLWSLLARAREVAAGVLEADDPLAPTLRLLKEQVDQAKRSKRLTPREARDCARALEQLGPGEAVEPAVAQRLRELVADALQQGRVPAQEAELLQERLDQAAQRGAEGDFLTAGALKERERRAKRQLSARERSSIMETVGAAEACLRDLALAATGSDAPPLTAPWGLDVAAQARGLRPEDAFAALGACERARADVAANVTPRLALEALLLAIKETLWHSSYR